MANLTLKNVVAIGKGIGSLIQVEDYGGANKTFRSFLRILIKINVHDPLKLGFLFYRANGEQFQISFKYERLDINCTSCGRISDVDRDAWEYMRKKEKDVEVEPPRRMMAHS